MSPALVALLALPAALAGEGEAPARGAEIGLVLDLGSSPERALDSRAQRAGALLLLGALSEADHLTVFAAGSDARSPPQIALDPTQIGALVGEAGGDGEPALRAASMAL